MILPVRLASTAAQRAQADCEVHREAMEVAVMSLSAREQHALESMESSLAGSDPGLASKLDAFTRVTSGESMPVREKLRPRPRKRRRSRTSGCPQRLAHGLGRPQRLAHRLGRPHAAMLVWLVISLALLATALAVSRSGGGTRRACAVSFIAACGRPMPSHHAGLSAAGSSAGVRTSAVWIR
jgi:hypothetical protein